MKTENKTEVTAADLKTILDFHNYELEKLAKAKKESEL